MASALRKAGDPTSVDGPCRIISDPVDQAAETRRHRSADSRNDILTAPLHPMHRDLLARIGAPPAIDPNQVNGDLTTPQRFAAIFYAAIAAWGIVAAIAGLIIVPLTT